MAKSCKVEGCNKLSQYNTNGMCKKHFTQSKKVAAVSAPVARVEPIASCGECGVIPCACFEDVSVLEVSSAPGGGMSRELSDLFDAKRAEWVADLIGATSEYSRSRLFVGMCDAIKGAGY